ncbi:MAG: RnfABCDGE type electron transport complex subunit D [Bacillota bacterium]|nr:RnfABCDGE type electron transport complex subunit D [Bacillota bacterium]
MSDAQKFVVTPSPHIKSYETVTYAMRDVFIALMPVTLVSIYFFQYYAALTIAVCLVTAVLTELLFKKLMHRKPALHDWSALLTGLFVALLFQATTPWYKAALATFIAVGIAKELAGGLGWNRFNPALFGRVALIILAPAYAYINQWFQPLAIHLGPLDTITQATPLAMMRAGLEMPPISQLFFAFPAGALSEVSPFALLIGAAYLFYKKHIGWRIPVSILGTMIILNLIVGENPLLHLVTGGIIIGAFFMATDWVTSPMTDNGKIIYGIAIGALIVLFRVGFMITEGVAYSILIMNAFVPMIEHYTARSQFGKIKVVAVPMAEKK